MLLDNRRIPMLMLGLWAGIALAVIGLSVYLSGGFLIYTLDDPYIHLAVTENILKGGYGVNYPERSAPSSSIMYPFLLCVTESLGLREKGPLLINILSMGGAVYLTGLILRDHICPNLMLGSKYIGVATLNCILALMVLMSMSPWGLIMTGMEHSLHVLLVVMLILGFLKLKDEPRRPPGYLVVAIVLMPTIRFEGMALSAASMLCLYQMGYKRNAILALMLLGLSFLAWFIYSKSMGLSFLPSSVLLKSSSAALITQDEGFARFVSSILENLSSALETRQGFIVGLAVLAAMALGLSMTGQDRVYAAIAFLAAFSGLAHLFLGRYGWFYRYEVYILVLLVVCTLVLAKRFLSYLPSMFFAILTVGLVSLPFYKATILTPLASRGIFLQQFQMQRFARNYWGRPIGVNDLGLVSYKNDNYVLDLYGLGSEEIRSLKMINGLRADVLAEIASRKGVDMFMLYDTWFQGLIPSSWVKVAILHSPKVSSASGDVSFYYSGSDYEEVGRLLRDFSESLPNGAQLEILGQISGKSIENS